MLASCLTLRKAEFSGREHVKFWTENVIKEVVVIASVDESTVLFKVNRRVFIHCHCNTFGNNFTVVGSEVE